MSYRDELVAAMQMLSEQPDVCFVGYNLCPSGGSAGGSLKGVDANKIFEMPLAENLMAGAAIGLALDGRVPVLFFERADFLFCGSDAIVNHINYLGKLSNGLHSPGVIIRVCIGNSKAPLFTGSTHCQDPFEAFLRLVSFQVLKIPNSKQIQTFYRWALEGARKGKSMMIFEEKDLYGQE